MEIQRPQTADEPRIGFSVLENPDVIISGTRKYACNKDVDKTQRGHQKKTENRREHKIRSGSALLMKPITVEYQNIPGNTTAVPIMKA